MVIHSFLPRTYIPGAPSQIAWSQDNQRDDLIFRRSPPGQSILTPKVRFAEHASQASQGVEQNLTSTRHNALHVKDDLPSIRHDISQRIKANPCFTRDEPTAAGSEIETSVSALTDDTVKDSHLEPKNGLDSSTGTTHIASVQTETKENVREIMPTADISHHSQDTHSQKRTDLLDKVEKWHDQSIESPDLTADEDEAVEIDHALITDTFPVLSHDNSLFTSTVEVVPYQRTISKQVNDVLQSEATVSTDCGLITDTFPILSHDTCLFNPTVEVIPYQLTVDQQIKDTSQDQRVEPTETSIVEGTPYNHNFGRPTKDDDDEEDKEEEEKVEKEEEESLSTVNNSIEVSDKQVDGHRNQHLGDTGTSPEEAATEDKEVRSTSSLIPENNTTEKETRRGILAGDFNNLPPPKSNVVRVFLSSTFSGTYFNMGYFAVNIVRRKGFKCLVKLLCTVLYTFV